MLRLALITLAVSLVAGVLGFTGVIPLRRKRIFWIFFGFLLAFTVASATVGLLAGETLF